MHIYTYTHIHIFKKAAILSDTMYFNTTNFILIHKVLNIGVAY